MNKKRAWLYISEEDYDFLKIMAIKRGKTVSELLVDYARELLATDDFDRFFEERPK